MFLVCYQVTYRQLSLYKQALKVLTVSGSASARLTLPCSWHSRQGLKNEMVASDCLFCDLSSLYYHCSDADIINKMKILVKSK